MTGLRQGVGTREAVRCGLPPSRLRQGYAGQAQPSPASAFAKASADTRGEGFGAEGGAGTPHPTPREARGHLLPQGEKAGAVPWDEVRQAYELSEETVGSILDRFGLSRYALEKQRVAEGWTTRPQVARPGSLRLGGASIGSQAIGYRLNRLVTVGLAMLEKRVGEEGMTEANARTLTELTRAQEIMMRTEAKREGRQGPREEERRCRPRTTATTPNGSLPRSIGGSTALAEEDNEEREAVLAKATAAERRAYLADWRSWARDDQLPPEGDWTTWLFLGGRGAGKTRAGAEWIRALVLGQARQAGRAGGAHRACRRDAGRRARRDGERRVGAGAARLGARRASALGRRAAP